MSNDQRINVDLEFLDKDEPVHAKPPQSVNRPPLKPTGYNWVGIVIVVSIIILLAVIRSI